jgi:Family of unknown function (DUF6522)
MMENRRDTTTSRQTIEFHADYFVVDAALVGELLHLPPSRIQTLMHSGSITSACERGVDEHAVELRLNFFYRNRRARVLTDLKGRILRKSAVDFGDRPISSARQRPVASREDPIR